MMYIRHREKDCHGFTLIEVMVAMVIALVLLAGVVGIFISQQRSADMVLDKTDRLSDLFLVSQIMQGKLRDAQAICWDGTNNRIVYQPQDSTTAVTDPCTTVDNKNGAFRFKTATSSKTASICWDRPNRGGSCQELVRNMEDVTSMPVAPTGNMDLKTLRKIMLTALLRDPNGIDRDVSLEFDVWPRN